MWKKGKWWSKLAEIDWITTRLWGDMFDCVAFSSGGGEPDTDGRLRIHPSTYCFHPDNGGVKHGCDLFEGGKLVEVRQCPFRVREGEPGREEERLRIEQTVKEFNDDWFGEE
jgi:hypothetical protein